MYPPTDPLKLLQAARTALILFDLIHSALWDLFPDEILALREEDQQELASKLAQAISAFPQEQSSTEDIF